MSSRWIILIFVLLGLWQVVGSLIEKAGKKQQAQRLKDLAAQRERQLTTRGTTPTTRRPATDRAETLAARRRAQLEQLRQRRTDRRTVADVSTGPAARPGAAPAAPPPAGRRPVTFQPAGPTQAPPPRRPVGQRPAPPTRPAPRPIRPPRPAPASIATRQPTLIELEESVRRVVEDSEKPLREGRKHRPLPRSLLPDEPLGPHALRQMVLYREILEPPVSIRDHQVWERV